MPLAVVLPYQVGRSVLKSTWDIFRNGIRALPPLVTAVVVVFVTSDAWRILGNGSANRFRLLIAVFVAASLLFLIRWRCWDDIDVSPKQADKLLAGIKLKRPTGFRAFIGDGYRVQPAPINRPGPLGTAWVYTGYWLLAAFALLMTMAFVALALIVVGVILINKNETITLANSAYVYHTVPGLVITRQLLLLSASLAAFAAFFLVAAQKPTDRKRFMRNVLVRYRRVLLVYTVYCAAHDHAALWTQVEVRDKPLDRRESGSGRGSPQGCRSCRTRALAPRLTHRTCWRHDHRACPPQRGRAADPAPLVDAAILAANLARMAEAWAGERLRPHVKAHKCTELARHQRGSGHPGFTCATIREVEGMVAAGLGQDLLLANEVLDASRLGALVAAGARVTVAVDSSATAGAGADGGPDRPLKLLGRQPLAARLAQLGQRALAPDSDSYRYIHSLKVDVSLLTSEISMDEVARWLRPASTSTWTNSPRYGRYSEPSPSGRPSTPRFAR